MQNLLSFKKNLNKFLLKEAQNSYRKETTSIAKLCAYKLLLVLKSLAYTTMYGKYKKTTVDRLEELKGKKSKNVFIFANGPSVNDLDFKKIKLLIDQGDWDLVTINSFASKAIDDFEIIPTLSIFADPFHYIGSEKTGLTVQAELDIKKINEKEIPAFVPYQFMKHSRFKNSIPFCSVSNVYSKNVSDLTRPLGYYPVTAFYALSLAINLGYKNIYLCGYDNSYFLDFEVSVDNKKYFHDKHFYDLEKTEKRHISNDHFMHTSDVFLNFYRHFKYLEKINKYKPAGVCIKNIAKRTYTDAFDRSFGLDVYM